MSSHVPSLFTVLARAAPVRRRARKTREKGRANDAAGMAADRHAASGLMAEERAAGNHKRSGVAPVAVWGVASGSGRMCTQCQGVPEQARSHSRVPRRWVWPGPIRAFVGSAPKRRALTDAWPCSPTGIPGRAGGRGDVGAEENGSSARCLFGCVAHTSVVVQRVAIAICGFMSQKFSL
jgi:hypothetical protein